MKYTRLHALALLLILCCFTPLSSLTHAQSSPPHKATAPPSKQAPFKIALILWRGETEAEKGFKDYLAQQNIPVDYIIKNCHKDKQALTKIIQDVHAQQPDLIYTFGTTVTLKTVGTVSAPTPIGQSTTPVVFNIVADPKGAKLTTTLKSSGRNITGVSHVVPMDAQLKLLTSIVKPIKSIGFLYNPQEKNAVLALAALENSIKENKLKDLTIIKTPISTNDNIQEQVAKLIALKPDVAYLPSDSSIISNAAAIVAQLHQHNIPTFSATENPIRHAKALMGLVSRYYNAGQFAGFKAEQILVHKKSPRDIPIQTLQRFIFLLNLPSAHQLAFYPPVNVLKFAQVIGADSTNTKKCLLKKICG